MSKLRDKCGKKPICLGWTQGCRDRLDAYQECVGGTQKNKIIGMAIAGVVGIVLIISVVSIFKRKK